MRALRSPSRSNMRRPPFEQDHSFRYRHRGRNLYNLRHFNGRLSRRDRHPNHHITRLRLGKNRRHLRIHHGNLRLRRHVCNRRSRRSTSRWNLHLKFPAWPLRRRWLSRRSRCTCHLIHLIRCMLGHRKPWDTTRWRCLATAGRRGRSR